MSLKVAFIGCVSSSTAALETLLAPGPMMSASRGCHPPFCAPARGALAKPHSASGILFRDKLLKLWKCAMVAGDASSLEPGKVPSVVGSQVTVKCGIDSICMFDHELTVLPEEGDYL